MHVSPTARQRAKRGTRQGDERGRSKQQLRASAHQTAASEQPNILGSACAPMTRLSLKRVCLDSSVLIGLAFFAITMLLLPLVF